MQIAEYLRGRQRIVEHVGSAHTEAELGMLLERARQLLDNPAQGVLELGIEPTPPVKSLIGVCQINGSGALSVVGGALWVGADFGLIIIGRV